MKVNRRLNIKLPQAPATPLLNTCTREMKIKIQKFVQEYSSGVTCNDQKQEKTQMSVN